MCYIRMFIYIYINIYSFNQTIVSQLFVSFIHRDFTKYLVMEIWFKVMEKSWNLKYGYFQAWKSPGKK